VREPVHFIPILTTLVALAFATAVLGRWRERRSGPHLLWWGAGLIIWAVGTGTEAAVTLFGWREGVFRTWYISGALLGGAPLAQGTVYMLLPRGAAHRLAIALVGAVTVAATCVLLSPIDVAAVEPYRLTGRVLEWRWVRWLSPFINLYAVTFLVGGAILSAVRYRRRRETHHRFVGNVLIAVGAILPGIGGAATRFGHTEVLYVTELVGLVLIWLGYRWNVREPSAVSPQPSVEPPSPAPRRRGELTADS